MLNVNNPRPEELPSKKQLFKSLVFGLILGLIIFLTIILPAEYAVDPTGIGKKIGLQEMGIIKKELAEEAEADRELDKIKKDDSSFLNNFFNIFISKAMAQGHKEWKDNVNFVIKSGKTAELKFTLLKGQSFEYAVIAEGGLINFDLHGHGKTKSKTYEKGRGSNGSEGKIVVDFDGEYGWFFRNRDKKDISITINLWGDYSNLKEKF
jgi:hypothetical protein